MSGCTQFSLGPRRSIAMLYGAKTNAYPQLQRTLLVTVTDSYETTCIIAIPVVANRLRRLL